MLVIEMNPRVSRSSALASKATGFPIAKIAAKLALGYHLDEIPNDITRLTHASFEPTIDYIVTKIPRWNFEKFPQADRTLTTQMKSVGFFFTDTPTTEIYTLSLHDALPISSGVDLPLAASICPREYDHGSAGMVRPPEWWGQKRDR